MKDPKILKCGFITLFLLPLHQVPAQWEQIPALSGLPVRCMVVIDDSTLLVGGEWSTLLRSTDNGATWESVWGNGITSDTVHSLGGGHGYFFAGVDAPASVFVFRSSDSGVNWSPSSTGLIGHAVGFLYVDTVLYAATSFGVYSSTDHGDFWVIDTVGLGYDPAYPGGSSNSTIGMMHVGTMLYAVKDFAKGVYATRSDTIRWFPLGLKGHWGSSMAAVDTNIFAAVGSGVVLYTGSDTTWIDRSNGLPQHLLYPILTAADSTLFLFDGWSEAMYVSNDLGLHWEPIGTSELGSTVNGIAATRTHVVVKSGTGGWRREVGSIVLSAKDDPRVTPYDFQLVQNYPNPFNGIANFGFSIADWADVKLGVYDILGREIAVLLNERKGPGSYTVQWDSGRAPSGVYFVRMEGGAVVRIVRAVLVK